MEGQIREPGFSGIYYPADEIQAGREISLLLESAPEIALRSAPRGIIVPHDSLSRCGGVVARAIRPLMEYSYKRLVIIAPSHIDKFESIHVYPGAGFKTSLGTVPVDSRLCAQLAEFDSEIVLSDEGHSAEEMAIEAILPFFQWAFGNLQIVPITMGLQSQYQIEKLSNAILQSVQPENILLVASSNFGYGLPENQVKRQLELASSLLETGDDATLWDHVVAHKISLCGYGPVLTVSTVAKKWHSQHTRILLTRTSADIDGNSSKTTGYLSAVFY